MRHDRVEPAELRQRLVRLAEERSASSNSPCIACSDASGLSIQTTATGSRRRARGTPRSGGSRRRPAAGRAPPRSRASRGVEQLALVARAARALGGLAPRVVGAPDVPGVHASWRAATRRGTGRASSPSRSSTGRAASATRSALLGAGAGSVSRRTNSRSTARAPAGGAGRAARSPRRARAWPRSCGRLRKRGAERGQQRAAAASSARAARSRARAARSRRPGRRARARRVRRRSKRSIARAASALARAGLPKLGAQQARLLEVVADDLVRRLRALLEPVGDARVQLGAQRASAGPRTPRRG